jgi:hypothetical protein
MNIMQDILGKDKMIGHKFPMIVQGRAAAEKATDEDKKAFLEYLYSVKDLEKSNKIKELNPNGFWEDGRFSVTGLAYKESTRGLVSDILKSADTKFCKIVSSGLNNTDPTLVDKIIYVIRDPHEVAKSQEKLRREGTFINSEGKRINLFEDMTINTPMMFIQSVISWAKFVLDNTTIPILYVQHQRLMTEPKEEVNKIIKFVGKRVIPNKRKAKKAHNIVDTSLYRSKVLEDKPSGLWEEAYVMYSFLVANTPKMALKYISNPKLQFNRATSRWICSRVRLPMIHAHCIGCKSNKEFREQLKTEGERNNADWKNEPCAYEVAYDLDNPHISIKESIKNNFWKE